MGRLRIIYAYLGFVDILLPDISAAIETNVGITDTTHRKKFTHTNHCFIAHGPAVFINADTACVVKGEFTTKEVLYAVSQG